MIAVFRTFVLRLLVARIFQRSRLIVYEGLVSMLTSGAGAKAPTFSAQFAMWSKRARSKGRMVWRAHEEIRRRLDAGTGLAQALAPFVPAEEVMIIDAGEASGKLAPTLESLIKSVVASREIDDFSKAAYKAPFVALISFIVLSWFSGVAVWPSIIAALPDKYWDTWSLVLVYAQIYLAENLWLLLVFVGIFAAYKYSLPRWTGQSRQTAEKYFPVYGSYRDRQAASLLIVLSGLLRAGKTIDQSLNHIAKQGTPYLRWHTRSMQRRLILFAGDPVRMLSTGIFSEQILDRIANAASSRQLADSIQDIGSHSIDQLVKTVKSSSETGANILYMLVGLLLSYYTAVQVLGNQQASDRYMREIKAGANASAPKSSTSVPGIDAGR